MKRLLIILGICVLWVGIFLYQNIETEKLVERMPAQTYEDIFSLQMPVKALLEGVYQEHLNTGASLSGLIQERLKGRTSAEQDRFWRETGFASSYISALYSEGPHNNQKIMGLLETLDVWNQIIGEDGFTLGDSLASQTPELTSHLETLGFDLSFMNKKHLGHMKLATRYRGNPELYDITFAKALESKFSMLKNAGLPNEKQKSPHICSEISSYKIPGGKSLDHCKKSLCSSFDETKEFCQYIYNFAKYIFPSEVALGNSVVLNQRIFRDCAFTMKLQLSENLAVVKNSERPGRPQISTVKIEPKFLSMAGGDLVRTYESAASIEIDYEEFAEFSSVFCSDVVIEKKKLNDDVIIGKENQNLGGKEYFNDHEGALLQTILPGPEVYDDPGRQNIKGGVHR